MRTDKDLDRPLDWGRRLIETRDIDPIYDMLWRAMEAREVGSLYVGRWMVAYWCLYHAGAAAYLAEYEGKEFWDLLSVAARNTGGCPATKDERWPRGTERRHWRGQAAIKCAEYLRDHFAHPELAVQYPLGEMVGSQPVELATVRSRVEEWPSFGPWISFKIPDLLERVLGYPIHFPDNVVFFDSPQQGMLEMMEVMGLEGQELLNRMRTEYADPALKPPGLPSRGIDVQELETIFCKWKSARGGHYWIGKDIHEIRHALQGWGRSASLLEQHLPPEVNE